MIKEGYMKAGRNLPFYVEMPLLQLNAVLLTSCISKNQ